MQSEAGDLVFKSSRRSAPALDWLRPVHRAAEAAGLIVPKLIASRNGRTVEDGWTCEPFLASLSLTPQEMPDLIVPMRRFHALCHDLPQRPGFLSETELCRADEGGDVDLSLMPPALAARCRAAWRALAESPQSIIHGDLSPANLLRMSEERIALLDWDESRRDACALDHCALQSRKEAEHEAQLAWEIACC